MFFGNIENEKNKTLPDLKIRELVYMDPLLLLSLWIGVYPKPFLEYIKQPVNAVVRHIDPTYQIPGMPPAQPTQERAQK